MIWALLLVLLCMPVFSPGAAILIMGLMLALWIGFDVAAALVLTLGFLAVLGYTKRVASRP